MDTLYLRKENKCRRCKKEYIITASDITKKGEIKRVCYACRCYFKKQYGEIKETKKTYLKI